MTPDDPSPDRLLDLLPQVVRASDAFAGRPLQALLRQLADQAAVVEADVVGLFENGFVETCDDWVLAYLGEVVGYRPVEANAPAPADDSPRGRARARALYPRREFARTVAHRRRKGALLQLQELAHDAAGWPARAVEFRHLIAAAWSPRVGGRPRTAAPVRDTRPRGCSCPTASSPPRCRPRPAAPVRSTRTRTATRATPSAGTRT